MTLFIVLIIWLTLAIFNVFKIYQSEDDSHALESIFAIVCAPIYTFLAFVVVFLIKKW